MRKTTRQLLADANQQIRDLKNDQAGAEAPLRLRIAEQESEIARLRTQVAALRAEFRHVQMLARYIVAATDAIPVIPIPISWDQALASGKPGPRTVP